VSTTVTIKECAILGLPDKQYIPLENLHLWRVCSMKKRGIVLTIILVIVLGISAWFYGYYNRKSNDNLPSLSLIAEMEEADVNELLSGYRRIQLRTVWDEPDFINSNEDIWKIDESTSLIVSYNNRDKVVICGFSSED